MARKAQNLVYLVCFSPKKYSHGKFWSLNIPK